MTEIQNDDLIECVLPYRQLKPMEDIEAENNRVGHAIHDTMARLGRATMKEIADQCNLPVERVKEHIEHHIDLKQPKFRIYRLVEKLSATH